MKKIGRLILLPFVLLLMMIPVTSALANLGSENSEEEPILVGRISHVEGQLMRYVTEEKDWVVTVKDAPFGVNDALYSGTHGRAEFMMPNNTRIRIDADTQIHLLALTEDLTEIDIASGVARFYNRSSDGVMKATTPFGYVMAPENTSFDLYVGDESVEVVALKGRVHFVHDRAKRKFEVIAGSSSILADSQQVTTGEGRVDPHWAAWNRNRESLWAKRMRMKGESARYLPAPLHDDAYVLEEYGRWERVYYDGGYHHLWRPVHVAVGWAPFTSGRWTVWYCENTWIPYEPFGYLTHHYGSWVFAGSFWYWAPPFTQVRIHVGPPRPYAGFYWYPGRVAWIHFGVYVGWVPLAPWEPYYCYRPWGPRAIVVNNFNITHINVKVNKYRNYKRAVIVRRNNLYNVESYKKVRIRNKNHITIANNFRLAPVVNDRVIRDYSKIKKKHNFTNAKVTQKPHPSVMSRIEKNHLAASARSSFKAKKILHDIRDISSGGISKDAGIKQPKRKQRLVPEDPTNRNGKQAKFQDREINRKELPKTEDQGKFSRRLQDERKWSPPKPARRQVRKRDDQRIVRGELQERKRSIPSKPARESSMRQEDKSLTIYQSLKTQVREASKPITRHKIRSSSPRLGRGEIQEERKETAYRGSVNLPSRFGSARGWDRGRNFKN
jgi:hypothetical protein